MIDGGTGMEAITLVADHTAVNAGGGNDLLVMQTSKDSLISGDEGNDDISGVGHNDRVTVYGAAGDDVIHDLDVGASLVSGGGGNDSLKVVATGSTLYGGAGNDFVEKLSGSGNLLDGGSGNDTLHSAAGKGVLTGGFGRDVFLFTAKSDSTLQFNSGAPVKDFDLIADFQHGIDKIDLHALGITGLGDGGGHTLALVYEARFDVTHAVNYVKDAGVDARFEFDLKGDVSHMLTAGDFIFA